MFKDTHEGSTHHNQDACYKCPICGDHFFIESQRDRCSHDYQIAQEVLKRHKESRKEQNNNKTHGFLKRVRKSNGTFAGKTYKAKIVE